MKLGLKIGNIEFDFEGSMEDFESKFEATFNELVGLGKGSTASMPMAGKPTPAEQESSTAITTMTVKSIAAKLDVDGGRELAYAAIASLSLFKKKEVFTRHEINEEMKQAIGYYKASYSSGNLSGYLDGLCKSGTIIETAKDTYTVRDSVRIEMEQKLAQ